MKVSCENTNTNMFELMKGGKDKTSLKILRNMWEWQYFDKKMKYYNDNWIETNGIIRFIHFLSCTKYRTSHSCSSMFHMGTNTISLLLRINIGWWIWVIRVNKIEN